MSSVMQPQGARVDRSAVPMGVVMPAPPPSSAFLTLHPNKVPRPLSVRQSVSRPPPRVCWVPLHLSVMLQATSRPCNAMSLPAGVLTQRMASPSQTWPLDLLLAHCRAQVIGVGRGPNRMASLHSITFTLYYTSATE